MQKFPQTWTTFFAVVLSVVKDKYLDIIIATEWRDRGLYLRAMYLAWPLMHENI